MLDRQSRAVGQLLGQGDVAGVIAPARAVEPERQHAKRVVAHAHRHNDLHIGAHRAQHVHVALVDGERVEHGPHIPGEQQRAPIARGLVHEPRIFFLDEPTTGVDPLEAARMAGLRITQADLDRERRIVAARMLAEDPCTLEKLGTEMGVSKERVRQLEARAKKKLQVSLAAFHNAA